MRNSIRHIQTLWQQLFQNSPLPRIIKPVGLRLEMLEDRTVPTAQISGNVFEDFNGNGIQNVNQSLPNDGGTGSTGLANDKGLGGVTVTAVDGNGAVQGQTTTAADGSYALNIGGTGPYRIQFSTPAGYFPDTSINNGNPNNNLGPIRFIADGTTTSINVGFIKPADYSPNSPLLATVNYVEGDPNSPANANTPTIQSFTYTAGSNSTTNNIEYQSPTTHQYNINDGAVGSVWGLAYNAATNTLYSAAFFKRHVGFGPGGPGAIYATNLTTGVTTTLTALNAGPNLHDTTNYNTDNGNTGWNAVGHTGLGGIALSPDGQTLYVVNLFDQTLNAISLSNPANVTSVKVPLPNLNGRPGSDIVPFALTYYQGQLYLGEVDTAESTTLGGTVTGNTNDLNAYVYSFNPANITATPTQVFSFALNYPRGEENPNYANGPGIPFTPGPSANWLPWSPVFQTLSPPTAITNTQTAIYPQAMFSSISFDAQGNMIIGLRDRTGDTTGNLQLSDPNNPTQEIRGIAGGDILRAFGNPTSGWTLENNGSGPGGTPAGGGVGNNLGPGGGRFYNGVTEPQRTGQPTTAAGNLHDQVASGSVLQLPGYPDVVTSVFDPIPIAANYFEGGFRWISNTTGTLTKAYDFSNAFGKANSNGSVIALIPPAPIEIGNRIWLDSTGNGQQVANQQGIAGLTVNLLRGGQVVATTTTNAEGDYFFTNENLNGNANLLANTAYEIQVPTNQASLNGLTVTKANAAGVPTDLNSKGVLSGANAVIDFTTGSAGQNNFSLDMGFTNQAPVRASVGQRVFLDSNGNGIYDPGEQGFSGVVVHLYDANHNLVASATTNANGLYSFTNLAPGTYSIQFDPTSLGSGYGFTLQGAGTNPLVNSSANPVTGQTATFTLTAGQNDLNLNAGVIPLSSLNGTVYFDTNKIGNFVPGDPGVGSSTLLLTGIDQNGNPVSETTTTDSAGNYHFTSLLPGTYSVQVQNLPNGYQANSSNPGSTGGTTGTDVINSISLGVGVNSQNNNFGVYNGTTDVQVIQSVNNPNPAIGSTVLLTFVVKNNGPNIANSVSMLDQLPAGLTFQSVQSITSGSFDPTNLRWNLGNVPPGGSAALTIAALVNDPGSFRSNAIVSTTSVDTVLSNNQSPVTIQTPADPGLVTKQNFLSGDPNTTVNPLAPATQPSATSQGIIVVGAGPGSPPIVQVFDRQTGTLRYSFYAYAANFLGGVNVAVGDVLGDGNEYIVTAPGVGGGPNVKVFNASTGALVRSFFAYQPTFSGGVNVAVADVNGDGAADIITGAGPGGGPHVKVFSGKDNSVLASFFAYNPGYTGGVTVAGGDLYGTGHSDIIVGTETVAAIVAVYDGVSLTNVANYLPFGNTFFGGVSVAAGDLRGVGKSDIIVGARTGGASRVQVIEGDNGAFTDSFFAYSPSFSGGINVAAADVTGTGKASILTAPITGYQPQVATFDPATQLLIDQFLANPSWYQYGLSLAAY